MEKWIKTAEMVRKNPNIEEYHQHRSLNWLKQVEKMPKYPEKMKNQGKNRKKRFWEEKIG